MVYVLVGMTRTNRHNTVFIFIDFVKEYANVFYERINNVVSVSKPSKKV